PAEWTGGLFFAAGAVGVSLLRLRVVRQALPPSYRSRRATAIHLLSLRGEQCGALWRAGPVSQSTAVRRAPGNRRVGRCVRPAGASGEGRGGVSAAGSWHAEGWGADPRWGLKEAGPTGQDPPRAAD